MNALKLHCRVIEILLQLGKWVIHTLVIFFQFIAILLGKLRPYTEEVEGQSSKGQPEVICNVIITNIVSQRRPQVVCSRNSIKLLHTNIPTYYLEVIKNARLRHQKSVKFIWPEVNNLWRTFRRNSEWQNQSVQYIVIGKNVDRGLWQKSITTINNCY